MNENKRLILPVFAAAFILAAAVGFTDSLSDARNFNPWHGYDSFSAAEFKEYGPANEPIEFSDIDYPLLHAAVFFETNRRRNLRGLAPYHHSAALEKAAYMHAVDMVSGGFFDHSNYSDSRKRTPSDRASLFGGEGAGENIATTFGIQYEAGTMVSDISAIPPHTYNSFSEALVEGWMNSPGHRANILDEHGIGYQYLGCGVYPDKNDKWKTFHAVQNFSYSGKGAGSSGSGDSDTGAETDRGERSVTVQYTLKDDNILTSGGAGAWTQLDRQGKSIYTYMEDSRDENYIYLYDRDRSLWLAVPLYGGKMYYKYGSGGSWQEWLITSRLE